MIKIILTQIKRHPVGMSFLVFGYIISLLLISIGTTSLVQMKELALAKTQGAPKNALTINANIDRKLIFEEYIGMFKDIKKDSNILFSDTRTYIDKAEKNKSYDIIYEFFTQKPDWTYPVLTGRYYTADDIKLAKKVVLIGKDLDKYTVNVNNTKNIVIAGENYEVIGLIGTKGKITTWDSKIFMPITSISELSKRELLDTRSLNCIIYNSNTSTLDDSNKIKENILKLDGKASISINELSSKDNIIANSLGNKDKLILVSVLIFIISLINSINITSYWINDRKKEIAIKKAFGHTNFGISRMLIIEMLCMNLMSCIISLLLQYIVDLFMDNVANIAISISIENFVVAVFIVLISSIVTSIIPIYKSLKIQPVEALKL